MRRSLQVVDPWNGRYHGRTLHWPYILCSSILRQLKPPGSSLRTALESFDGYLNLPMAYVLALWLSNEASDQTQPSNNSILSSIDRSRANTFGIPIRCFVLDLNKKQEKDHHKCHKRRETPPGQQLPSCYCYFCASPSTSLEHSRARPTLDLDFLVGLVETVSTLDRMLCYRLRVSKLQPVD